MNNSELEELLQDYPVQVICANELPVSIGKRPRTFIVNTDPCSRPGRHWTVFHFSTRGPAEFFDSLGNRPQTYEPRFEDVLVNNGPRYLYTSTGIQPNDSDTCGAYCVYFVRERYRPRSFRGIMKDFSVYDLNGNDRKVIRGVRRKETKQRWSEKTARTANVGS